MRIVLEWRQNVSLAKIVALKVWNPIYGCDEMVELTAQRQKNNTATTWLQCNRLLSLPSNPAPPPPPAQVLVRAEIIAWSPGSEIVRSLNWLVIYEGRVCLPSSLVWRFNPVLLLLTWWEELKEWEKWECVCVKGGGGGSEFEWIKKSGGFVSSSVFPVHFLSSVIADSESRVTNTDKISTSEGKTFGPHRFCLSKFQGSLLCLIHSSHVSLLSLCFTVKTVHSNHFWQSHCDVTTGTQRLNHILAPPTQTTLVPNMQKVPGKKSCFCRRL